MKAGALFDLSGRVAVVTGGMGQLGMVYAVALADHGAKVALLDTAPAPSRESADFQAHLNRGAILPVRCDITRSEDLRRSLDTVRARWGEVRVLINNAAIDAPPDAPADEVGPFEDVPEYAFDRVMTVNVKGMFLCCQVFGGSMARGGLGGAIVNISSTYGILSPCQDIYDFRRNRGEVFYKPAAYSVSKSAVLNLTRYLATYWAEKNVRVNTLTLGGVFNHQPEAFVSAYAARVPMRRMAAAEEYAGAVLFMCSDASSYMTGSNLVVDGGWSAW